MNGTNRGEWEILKFDCCEKCCYQIYRLRDKSESDSKDNREYAGPAFGNYAEARVWLEANRKGLPE